MRKRHWSTLAVFAALSIIAGLRIYVTPSATAAPGDPFPANEPAVFIAQGDPLTQLYYATADELTGEWVFETEGFGSHQYNGIGWNPNDGYIYGMTIPAGNSGPVDVIRVGQGGVTTVVDSITLPFKPWAGDFDPATNRLYVFGSGGGQGAWYNVQTGQFQTFSLGTGGAGIFDVVYSDGFFWGISRNGGIVRINPATNTWQSFPFPASSGDWGAAWKFGNGNLGFGNNNGEMYQVQVTNPASANPSFTLIAKQPTPSHNRNDGTSIQGLPVDLAIAKSGDATFGPGQEFEYTITVTNNGPGVSSGWTMTDTLPAGVSLVAVQAGGQYYTEGNKLIVTGGRLPAGETRNITLTVRADEGLTGCISNTAGILGHEQDPDSSNNSSTWQTCREPVLELTKSVVAPTDPGPGDVITYTITATNVGDAPFTAQNPAWVYDQMSGILDDADLDEASIAATRPGVPTYADGLLSWSGELAPAQHVEISYSATIKAGGDGQLRNLAWQPPTPGDETPPTECAANDPTCAETTTLLPKLTVEKTASKPAFTGVGDVVQYTVTVTNPGPGDFTTTNPAMMTDDLDDVLASGELMGTPDATVGEVAVTDGVINWSGVLTAGQSAVITYEVSYTASYANGQDSLLENTACIPANLVAQNSQPCATVQVPGPVLSQWKTVASSATPVEAGTVLTYTLHFENTGQAAVEVDARDYLESVLDDAEVTAEPTAQVLAAARDGNIISITGTLAPGGSAEVSYQVTVRADGQRGDSVATNFLLPGTEIPPDDGECVPTDPQRPTCTTTPIVGSMLIEKLGQGPNGAIPLTGAQFQITPPGGAPAIDVTEEVATGTFLVEGLAPGDYVLTETRAPQGYVLLAEAVPFTVLPSGAIEVTENSIAEVSHTDGTWRLAIIDVTAFELPLTGGMGNLPWVMAGMLLTCGAVSVNVIRRRGTIAAG